MALSKEKAKKLLKLGRKKHVNAIGLLGLLALAFISLSELSYGGLSFLLEVAAGLLGFLAILLSLALSRHGKASREALEGFNPETFFDRYEHLVYVKLFGRRW